VPTVIIPGWHGNEDDHWQSWLTRRLREGGRDVQEPAFTEVDEPDCRDWLAVLADTLADLPADGYDVVAHSLGAVLWLHHAEAGTDSPRPARVMLVAPPSPGIELAGTTGFFPPPLSVDAVRRAADGTILVGGADDPYVPQGIAVEYGRPLKMPTTVIPDGGHLNVESGFGPWPAMLDWCSRDNLAFVG
jgi:hypothetical protein